MKTSSLIITLFLLLCGALAWAASTTFDIDEHRHCAQCGMDRKAYGYSRMLIMHEDGTTTGTCSLHCVVVELAAHADKGVKLVQTADRNTHALIIADKAVWVIGGNKRGVMTARAKWAFATTEAARNFVDSYGGEIITWEAALEAAKTDAIPAKKR